GLGEVGPHGHHALNDQGVGGVKAGGGEDVIGSTLGAGDAVAVQVTDLYRATGGRVQHQAQLVVGKDACGHVEQVGQFRSVVGGHAHLPPAGRLRAEVHGVVGRGAVVSHPGEHVEHCGNRLFGVIGVDQEHEGHIVL